MFPDLYYSPFNGFLRGLVEGLVESILMGYLSKFSVSFCRQLKQDHLFQERGRMGWLVGKKDWGLAGVCGYLFYSSISGLSLPVARTAFMSGPSVWLDDVFPPDPRQNKRLI